MLQLVDVGRQRIEGYADVVGEEEIGELRRLASGLKGARVLHVNATPYGGGVSELLRSLVPLEQSLGVQAEWRVISGDELYFRVTKSFHNALQGGEYKLTRSDRTTYLAYNILNAQLLEGVYDFVIVHDPQPAAVRHFCQAMGGKWIWRCHIDTSAPNPEVWGFLRAFVEGYDALVFTMAEFVPPDLHHDRLVIIPPAIDPLSPKNMPLSEEMARSLLSWIGLPPECRPLITQVSRFDPWKDPLGVIQVWQLVRQEVPGVHLALVGSMALDDPEGWGIYSQLMEIDQQEPDLYVFTNLTGVGNIEVNALQRLSDVVIQKSIREGFGLVVSETLWKGTPMVAGRAGGIPMQMTGGGGFLVASIEECAEKVIYLLKNPQEAKAMAARGQETVRCHFLLTRLLRDELKLFLSLLG